MTPHVEKHFTAGDAGLDIVIGCPTDCPRPSRSGRGLTARFPRPNSFCRNADQRSGASGACKAEYDGVMELRFAFSVLLRNRRFGIGNLYVGVNTP
jgi:hypothetical protein